MPQAELEPMIPRNKQEDNMKMTITETEYKHYRFYNSPLLERILHQLEFSTQQSIVCPLI